MRKTVENCIKSFFSTPKIFFLNLSSPFNKNMVEFREKKLKGNVFVLKFGERNDKKNSRNRIIAKKNDKPTIYRVK